MVLPAGVFRLFAGAADRYVSQLSCQGRWGIAFVPVAIGVSAGWLRPACYGIGLECTYIVPLIATAASLIVYCFGRAVDNADEFPVALTPLTVALSLLFGIGAAMSSPPSLSVVVGLGVVTS